MHFWWIHTQFNIQLIYKPHFGKWILLFGPFRQLRAVRKKKEFEYFLATLRVVFQLFFGNFFFFKYCGFYTKKLYNFCYKFLANYFLSQDYNCSQNWPPLKFSSLSIRLTVYKTGLRNKKFTYEKFLGILFI
jgi:hypothetical protein